MAKKRKLNPHVFEEISELKAGLNALKVDVGWIKERIKALNRRIGIVKKELKDDINEKTEEIKETFKWVIGLIVGTLLTVILTKLI